MNNICVDCDGSGQYKGLFIVEPCRSCSNEDSTSEEMNDARPALEYRHPIKDDIIHVHNSIWYDGVVLSVSINIHRKLSYRISYPCGVIDVEHKDLRYNGLTLRWEHMR